MPRFQYVALDARGQESTGSVEANSANEAIGHLRQAGYFPTGVYEEGKAPAARNGKVKRPRTAHIAAPVTTVPKRKTGITLFQRQKVKSKILMIFTRQLATLIDSGLPLLRSLNVLAKQERDAVLKRTTEALSDSVQSGGTFSDALAQHPKIFNELYISMVKAGELGGSDRCRRRAHFWNQTARTNARRSRLDRSIQIAGPSFRRSHSQDLDFTFLTHSRHAGHQRRFHFAGVEYYPRHRRQYRHRQC